jgi:hypothetical protein
MNVLEERIEVPTARHCPSPWGRGADAGFSVPAGRGEETGVRAAQYRFDTTDPVRPHPPPPSSPTTAQHVTSGERRWLAGAKPASGRSGAIYSSRPFLAPDRRLSGSIIIGPQRCRGSLHRHGCPCRRRSGMCVCARARVHGCPCQRRSGRLTRAMVATQLLHWALGRTCLAGLSATPPAHSTACGTCVLQREPRHAVVVRHRVRARKACEDKARGSK